MFYPLPAETVFEAQKKSRRASAFLFFLLTITYLVLFNLLFVPAGLWWVWINGFQGGPPAKFFIFASGMAVILASIQFYFTSRQPLDQLLRRLRAEVPDPRDSFHQVFINLVQEAQTAGGLSYIRPIVIPSPGLNACALQDSYGSNVLGVTEGLLARLNRGELAAVICHETAHLCQQDSLLNTRACAMVSVFDEIAQFMDGGGESKKDLGLYGILVWFLALMGDALSRLVYTMLSREREYLADARAVAMCRNPRDLASALEMIRRSYKGVAGLPSGGAALFIVNPDDSLFEEGEGMIVDLFSTHPPLLRRLEKLMPWCKTDLATFLTEQKSRPSGLLESQPVSKESMSSVKCTHCLVFFEEWRYEGASIWRCPDCKGTVLRPGVLERLIARRWLVFTEEVAAESRAWRDSQKGTLRQRGQDTPGHVCPRCTSRMGKVLYSMFTQVVVERCPNQACRSVWCEAGRLETMQALVQEPGTE